MSQLETVPNTGKATTTGIGALTQLFFVVFAATLSLALPVIALAQQKENTMAQPRTATDAIRPFQVSIADAALADLRRRITATKWPEKETVADQSQGVPLAMIQEL